MENEDELMKNVPILNATDKDFKEELAFNLWSTQSCSDYRNDRERPYNGQPWTMHGIRGSQLVTGLTLRDIYDCLIKAMIRSSPENDYLDKPGEFLKCWDFSVSPEKPTQYLLDMQKQDKYISTKVETGNWREQDVYKLNWDNIDPIAIAQNMCGEIMKMMSMEDKIPKLKEDGK